MNAISRVAVLQMVSGADIQKNLHQVESLIQRAVDQGARLVVLPENFALLSSEKLYAAGMRERGPERPIRTAMASQAKHHGIWIVAGSIPLAQRPDGGNMKSKVRAVCFVYDDQGNEVARYDKIHLFDVDVDDEYGGYRESDYIERGAAAVVVDTPLGKLGLSICYDLRFPELYRQLVDQGAQLLCIPSAFTRTTGAAHWETLVRARAIENICYVLAPDQGGRHSPRRETYGNSMIVSPWGEVLARHDTGEAVVVADIDLAYLARLRNRMPIMKHRVL